MDTNTTKAIYEWIKSHRAHVEDYDFDLGYHDSACILFKFFAQPENLVDYEDPVNYRMLDDHKDEHGCEHTFRRGPLITSRCFHPTAEGSNRCQFHNHVIFSDEIVEFRRQFIFN